MGPSTTAAATQTDSTTATDTSPDSSSATPSTDTASVTPTDLSSVSSPSAIDDGGDNGNGDDTSDSASGLSPIATRRLSPAPYHHVHHPHTRQIVTDSDTGSEPSPRSRLVPTLTATPSSRDSDIATATDNTTNSSLALRRRGGVRRELENSGETGDAGYEEAWPGGTGGYKLALNYAPMFEPQRQAAKLGYDQCLWLLGDKITEAGAMNFFVVVKRRRFRRDHALSGRHDPAWHHARLSRTTLPGLSPSIRLHPAERTLTMSDLSAWSA
ncbi:hypothetical protein C8Q76DRAFT_798748 [Earliella scabrosa]|nr:hypothetical protein C8Q76DRAFT_798748 [Earliella scabrosa]